MGTIKGLICALMKMTLEWRNRTLEYNGSEQMSEAVALGVVEGDTCMITASVNGVHRDVGG